MSIALRSAHQLVDEVLDKGLPFVAGYIERIIHRRIIITDDKGLIHYPEESVCGNMYKSLPGSSQTGAYYYNETDKCLFYRVEHSGTNAWVIVDQVPMRMVASISALLSEARLAIKCYFSHLVKKDSNQTLLHNKLLSYLFSPTNENIEEIIKLHQKPWNSNTAGYISIIRAEGEWDVNWLEVCSFTQDYFQRARLEAIPLIGPGCFIVLWPARIIHEVGTAHPELPRLSKYHEAISSQFSFEYSVGIGQTYPLPDIQRSFLEARIALTVPTLIKERKYVNHFGDMGFLSHLFSSDLSFLKDYCLMTLGIVLEHDRSNHGELIATLRQLLNSSFNCRATADSLFIHINTLYYRMNKIQELLAVDLSQMNVRVNLYTAILVWDTLRAIGETE